ncbi:DUF2158 domain-containing protein [Massilia sp. CCM 8733]|uniref:DUF2158 domain-containing protein n=1 Tax=Massilia mucilaginosa TaxID=2609282 RepID=A0ABX0P3Y5_9BURK|nr:DUF2158 domain-containing protein [Massilia mucilaginosa]NHZ93530.1 DUF2158 domain-containing protein [Massilia mucilaginosa]
MSDIAKGKVVQLISGGPQMSVVDVSDYNHSGKDDTAKCVWFDAKNVRCEDVFDVAVLKLYEAPASDSMRVTRA